LFENLFIIAPLAAWLIAHSIKLLIDYRRGELSWPHVFKSGGFPSGHTSIVTALATTSVLELGWGDPLTGAVIVLMVIVIYDAQGVRRAAEVLAAQVSQLSRDTKIKLDLPTTTARGHTIAEIIGGVVNGGLVALAITQLIS